MKLNNKIALITGGSSGLGRDMALEFAREGSLVMLAGRNRSGLEETRGQILGLGGKAEFVTGNLKSKTDCQNLVRNTLEVFGRLDILVNNAGIIRSGGIQNTTDQVWDELMDVNLKSVYWLTQAASEALIKNKGCVLNISSVTGLRPYAGMLGYCVAKAGLDMLTQCVALDLAPHGVRVNSINPGVVVTNLHRNGGMGETQYAEFLARGNNTHPLGRVGQPADVSKAAVYLCSEEASWTTGVIFPVDGGRALTSLR